MNPRKILHPTDYSDLSRPALRAAAALAHDHKAELVLLHVVETLGPDRLPYSEAASRRQPEGMRERLWEELRHARPADPSIQVEYVLSEEDPVTAILRTASVEGCDLIVMGTHGLTGWARWLSGSIAEEVVRRAPCSVLVVKPLGEATDLPEITPSEMNPGYLTRKEPDPSPGNG